MALTNFCHSSLLYCLSRRLVKSCDKCYRTSYFVAVSTTKPTIIKNFEVRQQCRTVSGSGIPQKLSNDWVTIYRFPYIIQARLINRLKLFQTGVTIGCIPVALFLYAGGIIGIQGVKYVSCTTLLACTMLYVMGSYFRRLIGFVYIHKNRQVVKVAHLTFWGSRRDIVVPVDDIVPFSDYEVNMSDWYLNFCQYSTKEKLYISLKFGEVLHKELFQLVFGYVDLKN